LPREDISLWSCPLPYPHVPYLSSPADPLPDAEVDQDPGDGQGDGQWPADLAWLIQSICHLVHVAPGGTKKGESLMEPAGAGVTRGFQDAETDYPLLWDHANTVPCDLDGDCEACYSDCHK
jgi:hypothetical protein